MDYFSKVVDDFGYIHSIDNVIMVYEVMGVGLICMDRVLLEIQSLHIKYPDINYWEKLNLKPSTKYSFYSNFIHLDDGISVSIGHYTDYCKETKEFYVFPQVELKVNPNKHFEKAILRDLIDMLSDMCHVGYLVKYDYAIDIPVAPDGVQLFDCRKEKGLSKGTRYFGQRNKNGYIKIYDKADEQHLINTNLTRVEHTLSFVKTTKKPSFDTIYVVSEDLECPRSDKKVNPTTTSIISMCRVMKEHGIDYEPYLIGINYRTLKYINEQLMGSGYNKVFYEQSIVDALFEKVFSFFNVTRMERDIEEEFLPLPDDFMF